jgi:molybdopterin molybdotransferase
MSMLDFDQALARLLATARPVAGIEEIVTLEADGRVLAQPQHSDLDVPPLDNTSMDGYAVRCADVPEAGTRLPVSQRIPAGSAGMPLAPGTAARIFTGAPIPRGADAVVMQELCEHGDHGVVINHLPRPGEWIRRAGEDIRRGACMLEAGTRLRPQELGLAASVGLARLPVFRRPRVALFSTGDELVMPGQPLPAGAIYNSNRYVLQGLLRRAGCQVSDLGIVPDRLEATRAALREAAGGHDLILTSGGVSVGEEDHLRPAVQAEGELDLWKIAIKPGKPLALGRIGQGARQAAFVGLPGNPVSSFVTFALLVRPFVLRLQGVADVTPAALELRADFDWPKPDPRREFLRVRRNASGGLDLFPNQSSGVLTSAVWGDGLVDNPPGRAIRAGDAVRFLPFSELLN